MVAPITPKEMIEREGCHIPSFVIEAFNDLIQKRFSKSKARFTWSEIKEEVAKRLPADVTLQQAMSNNWFDVEPVFRRSGWNVVYDHQSYGDSQESHYVFTAK